MRGRARAVEEDGGKREVSHALERESARASEGECWRASGNQISRTLISQIGGENSTRPNPRVDLQF